MRYKIPMSPLPDDLEISDVLTEDEIPVVRMKELSTGRHIRTDEGGGAFHEKLAKNKKVNVKIRHKDKMMEKYGKPKTRGKKK